MLKSTYKPSTGLGPLPPGWSEHTAPTGHKYYFNSATGLSTYTRPGDETSGPPANGSSGIQYRSAVSLSNPVAANAFLRQVNPDFQPQPRRQREGDGDGNSRPNNRTRPQPVDRPRSKVAIPGCEPWILVNTKYGRRFVYNPVKNASYWRIPDKLKTAILELDQARIREKALGAAGLPETDAVRDSSQESENATVKKPEAEGEDSDDYEEVLVTDSEDEDDENVDAPEGSAPKRQRMEEPAEEEPSAENAEEYIAYQLRRMGAQSEPDETGGLDGQFNEEGDQQQGGSHETEEDEFTEEDAKALFVDLLNDFGINPYSPWEKLLENEDLVFDPRYTVFHSKKDRRAIWEQWSKDKIKELKDKRAKEEKKDPRILYMEFLQEHATPKLYWPEFKRKYRKEAAMKDAGLSDKDREKWYRDLINRRKLPEATLKADFKTLLQSQPLSVLNRQTLLSHLPPQILVDMRHVSLGSKVREPLLEAYIQTLAPPPDAEDAEQDEAQKRDAELRKKREEAMRKRQQAAAEDKRRIERDLQFGKALLREEEAEVERAMKVDKRGLQSQLRQAVPDESEQNS